MVDPRIWRSVCGRNVLVEADQKTTTDQKSIQAMDRLGEFSERRDRVWPKWGCFEIIGETVEPDITEPAAEFRFRYERKEQVAVVRYVKGATNAYFPSPLACRWRYCMPSGCPDRFVQQV